MLPASLLLATTWLGVQLLDPALPDLLVLLLPGLAGAAAYALVLRVLFAATWRDLTALAGQPAAAVGLISPPPGRVAQWESARFTRERSQVRNPPRPSSELIAPWPLLSTAGGP